VFVIGSITAQEPTCEQTAFRPEGSVRIVWIAEAPPAATFPDVRYMPMRAVTDKRHALAISDLRTAGRLQGRALRELNNCYWCVFSSEEQPEEKFVVAGLTGCHFR